MEAARKHIENGERSQEYFKQKYCKMDLSAGRSGLNLLKEISSFNVSLIRQIVLFKEKGLALIKEFSLIDE